MTLRRRMIGSVRIRPGQKLFYRYSAGAWSEIDLNPELVPVLLYPTGNGESYDLLAWLNARIDDAGQSSYFALSLDTDPDSETLGHIKLTIQSTKAYFGFGARGSSAAESGKRCDNLWRILYPDQQLTNTWLLTSNPGSVTRTVTANVPHGFGFYPERLYLHWRMRHLYGVAQGCPDSGAPSGFCYSMRRQYDVTVGVKDGYPRALVWNEHTQLMNFLAHASRGLPVLLQHDVTSTDIYSRSRKMGGVFGVLAKETADWSPGEPEGNYYGSWEKDLLFERVPAPLGTGFDE